MVSCDFETFGISAMKVIIKEMKRAEGLLMGSIFPSLKILEMVIIIHVKFGKKDKFLLTNIQYIFLGIESHSSNVEIFPGSCPNALAFSTRLIILPERVFGNESTNSICSGFAIGPTS